jgi:hypothetical protein
MKCLTDWIVPPFLLRHELYFFEFGITIGRTIRKATAFFPSLSWPPGTPFSAKGLFRILPSDWTPTRGSWWTSPAHFVQTTNPEGHGRLDRFPAAKSILRSAQGRLSPSSLLDLKNRTCSDYSLLAAEDKLNSLVSPYWYLSAGEHRVNRLVAYSTFSVLPAL